MKNFRALWFIATILVLFDLYIFQVVKFLSSNLAPKSKIIVYSIFWLISILSIAIIFLLPQLYLNPKYKLFITYAFSIVLGLFFFKLIVSVFFLMDDIRRLITWIVSLFGKSTTSSTTGNISRNAFLSWLGIAAGGTLFSSLVFGFNNKYNYKIRKVKLNFSSLPTAFKGLKIVQLSDIHSGSFTDKAAVERGVEKVKALNPDIILFTGDLVNDLATEMHDYKDLFATLNAPLGVYSTLGNHDYGDYHPWEDRDEEHRKKEIAAGKRLRSPLQEKNLEDLKQLQKEMGWKLLMNEHIVFEKENDKIALLGIENWGARGNFPKYGKLDEAHKGTEDIPFKILMSHDPSHWDAQVTPEYKDIDLTLSGHTHGMQFGVEIPGFKWSPIQYFYKQWAGVYENNHQKLYINRGFGFLGYPGRVGILPEITLIELS